MFIKKLKPNVYDVFLGNGWNKWARVARTQGEVQQVAGNYTLDQRTISHVKGRIIK
jgi:hypothetical protein